MKFVSYILTLLLCTSLSYAEEDELSPNSQISAVLDNSGDTRLDPNSTEFVSSRVSPEFIARLLSGYDTNVLLLNDPSMLPGLTTSSWFVKPSLQTIAPLGDKGFALDCAALYTHNFAKAAQIYDHIFASFGIDYASKHYTAYLLTDWTWYNLERRMRLLSMGETLGMRGIPWKGKDWSFAYNLAFRYVKYPSPINTNPSYNADGPLFIPSVTLKHPLSSLKFTESILATKQWAKGSNLRMESLEGRIGIAKELFKHIDAEANFYLIRAIYPGSVPYRVDQILSSELEMYAHIGEHTKLNISAAFWRTYSTLFTTNYTKYIFTFGVAYESW